MDFFPLNDFFFQCLPSPLLPREALLNGFVFHSVERKLHVIVLMTGMWNVPQGLIVEVHVLYMPHSNRLEIILNRTCILTGLSHEARYGILSHYYWKNLGVLACCGVLD